MDPTGPKPGHSSARRARRTRRVALPVAAVALAAIAFGGWLAVRGLAARSALDDARAQLTHAAAALSAGQLHINDPALRRAVDAASADTARAHRLTSDPLWRLAGAIPLAGCPLRSSAELAAVGQALTREVVRPLAAIGPLANPVTTTDGVRVDVGGLKAAAPRVRSALERVAALTAKVSAVSTCGGIGDRIGLRAARADVLDRLHRLSSAAPGVNVASRVLPAMLGADAPRRYLLIVQNGAESRATGGILGGVGVLSATDGRLSLGEVLGNSAVPSLPPGFTLPLAQEVRARYARNGLPSYWQDANLTPDFPTAAKIYTAMWQASTGQRVDGVLALDPTTLSYLVSATGPVQMPDGQRISGAELVPLLESKIYSEIAGNAARDQYFAAAGSAIYTQVLSGRTGMLRLMPVLGRSIGEGRLLLWSAHQGEQIALTPTPLAGALPTGRGPYLAVITQNATSGKLDYYLHRQTSYQARRLPDGTGAAVLTVRLTNGAPRSGLPPYVLAHDLRGRAITTDPGRNVVYLSVYGGVGASFDDARLDGRPVNLESEVERGHSVFSTWVSIDAGQAKTFQMRLSEPDWRPTLTVRPQPLVNPEALTVAGIRVQLP